MNGCLPKSLVVQILPATTQKLKKSFWLAFPHAGYLLFPHHQTYRPKGVARQVEAPLCRMRIRAMRQIQPLFKQREAWLQFAKQAVERQIFQLAISSPLKEQSLRLPLSFRLPLFLAAPEMRDDPPLRRWQAWVGDCIARARNIDRKTKSV